MLYKSGGNIEFRFIGKSSTGNNTHLTLLLVRGAESAPPVVFLICIKNRLR